ncbi:MAG: MAPEG family protein [Novosphingobium sp.]
MFNAANQVSIFVPMLVIAALTFIAFVRMGISRGSVAKSMDPDFYRAHQGGQEPESAAVATRHYGNLFEMPTLFYAACLTAYVLQAVGQWTLNFAWAYVLGRLIQSAVHLTYNNPMHRGMGFILGVLAMLALWVNLGIAICGKL